MREEELEVDLGADQSCVQNVFIGQNGERREGGEKKEEEALSFFSKCAGSSWLFPSGSSFPLTFRHSCAGSLLQLRGPFFSAFLQTETKARKQKKGGRKKKLNHKPYMKGKKNGTQADVQGQKKKMSA